MAALVLRRIAAGFAGLVIVLVRRAVIMVRRGHVVLLSTMLGRARRRSRTAGEGVHDRGHSLQGNYQQQRDQKVTV